MHSSSIMEKGCSPASNISERRAKEAQRAAARRTQLEGTQPKASTSQVRLLKGGGATAKGAKRFPERSNLQESMSKLREDVVEDCCVSSNSQHGFAVVLDDESSTETAGVLETYEISSSNSLPNCNTGHATSTSAPVSSNGVVVGVVVPVDDSSSTDTTLGNANEDNLLPCAASEEGHSVFYHNNNDEPPVVCLINDEDDFDEEEEIVEEEEDEEDDDEEEEQQSRLRQLDCPNTSSSTQLKGSESIIVTADGSKIYLETPVVDEPQSHAHTLTHTHANTHTHSSSNSQGSKQETASEQGKPKRLSDEFESEANRAHNEEEEQDQELLEGGVKSEPDVATTSLHDRQMSVRLKQMSLGAEAAASCSTAPQSLSKADIDCMDRIERRDFEREQQLTGGIILGTSSLISKNRLNLSLINGAGVVGAAAADDWPSSSSNGRAFNSDSKVS